MQEALSREELELAVGALEKLQERARELDRQWSKRIEAARYEAERAARRYHSVEPENRLVARTLEREWNTRLEELERLEEEYAEVKRKPPFELSVRRHFATRLLRLSRSRAPILPLAMVPPRFGPHRPSHGCRPRGRLPPNLTGAAREDPRTGAGPASSVARRDHPPVSAKGSPSPADRGRDRGNCGIDVEKMDTTFKSPDSPHDVHRVACLDCHPKGAPKRAIKD